MQHRSEIDGLRAVAVVPAVAFHAGFAALPGGYLGVDVFFVISGYLITSIILDGLSRGTFTFREFYERRARRILPALLVMLAGTTVVAWFVLLPQAFRHFGISAASVAMFASNLYFLRTTDYFEAPTEFVPLIHTWSLGVEEQFYFMFPMLAVLVVSRSRATLLISVLMLASLALAQWAVAAHPAASFYLLPTRAWELLAGSLLAYSSDNLARLSRRIRELLALAGLAALLCSYVIYDRSTPVPSLYTLLPVGGTALVIAFATAQTWVGRLLSCRPLTFVGLISYSSYLWHQPLFAFARHVALNEPPALVLGLLSLVAFALGAASWYFVEQPFRKRTWLTRGQVFALAGAASMLVVAFGVASGVANGFRNRFDAEILSLLDTGPPWIADPCHDVGTAREDPASSCVLGDARRVVGVLIGDSHAGAMAKGLGESLSAEGVGVLQLTLNGCPPLPDVYRSDLGFTRACDDFYRKARALLAASPSVEHVIVLARWTRILHPAGFDNGEGGVETTRDRIAHISPDGRPLSMSDPERFALIALKARTSIAAWLDMGKNVVLVYPIPEVGWDAPTYLARRALHRRRSHADLPLASTSFTAFQTRNRTAFAALDEIGPHPRLTRIYPHRTLCAAVLPGRCIFQQGSQALYTDHNHVSLAGARLIAPEIARALTRRAPTP